VKHENFDIPDITWPSLTDQATVGLENAIDKTEVELHNAKEKIKAGAINTGLTIKEGAEFAV
jgi:hypothetical protein